MFNDIYETLLEIVSLLILIFGVVLWLGILPMFILSLGLIVKVIFSIIGTIILSACIIVFLLHSFGIIDSNGKRIIR